ncbi:MAG: hypothetical protein HY898_22915 [Deltaproteobacteria bacterium]|nr:hypothetical protein [Deltaproteobacteria bacterium]
MSRRSERKTTAKKTKRKPSMRGDVLRALLSAEQTAGMTKRLRFSGQLAERYADVEAVTRAVMIALATKDQQQLGKMAREANRYLQGYGTDVIGFDGRRVSREEYSEQCRRLRANESVEKPVDMLAIGGPVRLGNREPDAVRVQACLMRTMKGDRSEPSRRASLARLLTAHFLGALVGTEDLKRDVESKARVKVWRHVRRADVVLLSVGDAKRAGASVDMSVPFESAKARAIEAAFSKVLWTDAGQDDETVAQSLVIHGLIALGYPSRSAYSAFETSATTEKRRALDS